MNTGDIIALVGCTLSLVVAIVRSAAWVCNRLERLSVAIANAVTHAQCAIKRDTCPCVQDIIEINQLINEKHPRK